MLADAGLVVLRGVTGLLFVGHGLQKLAGWFGGHGLAGTGRWMESVGLRPGRLWAAVAGAAETLGGLLLALGAATPVAGALLTAVMATAIVRVHWDHGLWVQAGGAEHALVNMAVAMALALTGAGRCSVDAVWGLSLPAVPLVLAGLAAGLVVGVGTPVATRALRPAAGQAA
ncbi:MAG: DoxX family protein [Armatimonadota bacterium]|nr:DoxX family protein [Armatimonadota bacterium]MDR7401556.1 DoxX family protein [Armatimonadota bacterium]MDR7403298.1 DoxX family protein [Armatimonadota bacterium]MDR7438207.1 DoxX family protein [Armatimonadota bacterium]MDR7471636.1 DoxX family protein [Armatimonadota bacterium]